MDSSILLAVAACLLAIYLSRWLSSKNNLPPGPIGLPIVGYIPFLSRKVYLDFNRLAKKYGNVFRLQIGSANVVILNDFESTKEAFAKDEFNGIPPNPPFDFNKETFETGALNGQPWIETRRFSLHMLRDLGLGKTKMEEHIQDEINELFEQLGEQVGKPYCISELLASSMSNNISSLVFGKRLKYNDPDRLMMTRVLKETCAAGQTSMWQMFFPTLKKICEALGIGDVHKIRRIQKELKDYVKKAIDEHAATLDPNNIRDYIDAYLLEIEKKKNNPSFCKSVLEDLVLLLFGAGSETVRMGVEWLVLTAAHHQEGQRHIQQEIDDVIGQNQIATWMDRKSMPYTEAFIMELMRWKTIIPIAAFRYAIAGGNVCGHCIPKHTMIMSNFWGIHHNPDYWGADAEDFKPERFLSDDGQEVKKWEHYLPFSIGKRACLGEPLAKIEIFLYFVSILQRFDISVPDGKILDFDGEFGLLPKPQDLIFSKRK